MSFPLVTFVSSRKKYMTEIELLIKALGTMVQEPHYAPTDPTNIGAPKQYIGSITKPILVDNNRKIVEDKLIKLIEKL